jgi:transketolase
MVGVAVGLHDTGIIPFIGTFGAFFTRAFDQLRMAAIGGVPLRCVGTHVGISTGEDGPSQMGLEDIALFRSLPGSVVLSPADGVAAAKMAELMANYHAGISYVRLARSDSPLVYPAAETFEIGGSKVLVDGGQGAVACVVATGMAVQEALLASELLRSTRSLSITVIDAYSIKPLDTATLRAKASECNGPVVVVEDAYEAGGLGEAVAAEIAGWETFRPRVVRLRVTQVPRSGHPAELRKWAGISSDAIVDTIRSLVGK